MRANTIWRCIVNDRKLKDLFYDASIINLTDRAVLEAICKNVSRSENKGVFIPDTVLYHIGKISLVDLVARWVEAVGSEDIIAESLQRFAKYGVIGITDQAHIAIPAVLRSKSHSSAQNGRLSPGRPRKDESQRNYKARVKLHKAGVLSEAAILPTESETLSQQFSRFLIGPELQEALYKPLSLTQIFSEGRDHAATEAAVAAQQSPSIAIDAVVGKIDANNQKADQPPIAPVLPPSPVTVPQQGPSVQQSQPGTSSSIDEDAFLLGSEAGKRCGWGLDETIEATDVFRKYLQKRLTVKAIKGIIFGTTNKCKSVQDYIPKLERAVSAKGLG